MAHRDVRAVDRARGGTEALVEVALQDTRLIRNVAPKRAKTADHLEGAPEGLPLTTGEHLGEAGPQHTRHAEVQTGLYITRGQFGSSRSTS